MKEVQKWQIVNLVIQRFINVKNVALLVAEVGIMGIVQTKNSKEMFA